jgi:SPP1 family predicted phage head-tail adaptor
MAASGRRDRFVTVQQLSESRGASGAPIESWTRLTDVWAAKTDIRGFERFIANQISAPYDTKWDLHYSAEWDPDRVDVRKRRRLVVEGRVHDIVAAQEIGRRQGVEVMTLAGGLLA